MSSPNIAASHGSENPSRASFYADSAASHTVTVRENVRLARDTYRIRFAAPEIARRITPGQFLMLRLSGCNDPLLGRPLALYDTVLDASGEPTELDVVYLVQGKMTRRLAQLAPGNSLEVWGPLGNGFAARPTPHLVMVAGGIGQTPFMALGREYRGLRQYGTTPRNIAPLGKVSFCYGARTADYLAGLDEFAALGIELHVATDDGSAGHHGFVTDVLQKVIDQSATPVRVVCCGPEPMMEAVAHLSAARNVVCEVSLETPMACGIGICFTCVAKVRDGAENWDYKRTCVDGPVFNAARLVW